MGSKMIENEEKIGIHKKKKTEPKLHNKTQFTILRCRTNVYDSEHTHTNTAVRQRWKEMYHLVWISFFNGIDKPIYNPHRVFSAWIDSHTSNTPKCNESEVKIDSFFLAQFIRWHLVQFAVAACSVHTCDFICMEIRFFFFLARNNLA